MLVIISRSGSFVSFTREPAAVGENMTYIVYIRLYDDKTGNILGTKKGQAKRKSSS
jgi:hypothetical protein